MIIAISKAVPRIHTNRLSLYFVAVPILQLITGLGTRITTMLNQLSSSQLVSAISVVVLSFIANYMSDFMLLDVGEMVFTFLWDALTSSNLMVTVLALAVAFITVGLLLFCCFRPGVESVVDVPDEMSVATEDEKGGSTETEISTSITNIEEQSSSSIQQDVLTGYLPDFKPSQVVWIRPYVQKLLHYLRKESVGVIGIVGEELKSKSSLLQAIMDYFDKLDENNRDKALFQHRIYTAVVPSTKALLKDIAACLKLEIPSDASSDEIKDSIFSFLKDKNFLLLLGDLPKDFTLKSVGIPNPYDMEELEQCKRKVIFTASSEEICSRMSAKTVKLKYLNSDEAWNLFKQSIGDDTILSRGIDKHAREMAEEYSRLPVLLGLVGRTMSGKKDPRKWKKALALMRGSQPDVIPSMEESIFRLLKLGYDAFSEKRLGHDGLQEGMLKKCFLSCSLWPEDVEISKRDLIHCWMVLGFIKVSGSDLNAAYDQGHYVVKILQKVGILDPEYDDATVKMHDIIRDFALWIVANSDGHPWVVRAGVRGEAVINVKETVLKTAELISLTDSGMKQLPKKFSDNCKKLSVLLLNVNKVRCVPSGVLSSMTTITYLDLSYNPLEEFPHDVEHLSQLKYLNLSSTGIRSLPKELRKLKKLEYLLIRYNDISQIPDSLIQSLPSLLVLDAFPSTTLDNDSVDYFHEKLGKDDYLHKNLTAIGMACFKLRTLHKIHNLPTRWLRIWYLENLPSLELKLIGSNMGKCLQELDVSLCDSFKKIVVTSESAEDTISDPLRLRMLRLSFLQRLESVTSKFDLASTLKNLEILTISHCPRLQNITWILKLPKLKQLHVSDCKGMQRLIGKEENNSLKLGKPATSFCFTRLRVLELHTLPQLLNICDYPINMRSLIYINILDCHRLRSLPFTPEMASENKSLEIHAQESWWKPLKWDLKTSFVRNFRPIEDDTFEEDEEEEEEYDDD